MISFNVDDDVAAIAPYLAQGHYKSFPVPLRANEMVDDYLSVAFIPQNLVSSDRPRKISAGFTKAMRGDPQWLDTMSAKPRPSPCGSASV